VSCPICSCVIPGVVLGKNLRLALVGIPGGMALRHVHFWGYGNGALSGYPYNAHAIG
jgi:hypothetical protein